MTTSSYTFTASGSWAVKALAIKPAVPATPASFIVGSDRDNGIASGTNLNLNLSTLFVSVGDLLIAGVAIPAGAITVTPPAGWTTVPAITGAGTRGVKLTTFWKIAASGDLANPLNFTMSSSTAAVGVAAAYTGFDAGNPVPAFGTSVSVADGTVATGPASPAAGYRTVEIDAARRATTPGLLSGVGHTGVTSRAGITSTSGLYIADNDYLADPRPGGWTFGTRV